ncbi:MAG: metallophosphoesterase [Erysipelotrichaceae bacterium]|nr:metallophosphoesterase [Erysipelotrichaceae bacterium]MDD3809635.1 metallophosphoesterase [Erysipelotrichaceae bacterium]
MKKIVVVSDNHGSFFTIDMIKAEHQDAHLLVHCGDSEGSQSDMEGYLAVAGNNDWLSDFPDEEMFECEGLNFLVNHGDRYGYFHREENMVNDLKNKNCDVLLSGHTHIPQFKTVSGFTLVNPGSCSRPRGGSGKSYLVLYVEKGAIDYEFIELG